MIDLTYMRSCLLVFLTCLLAFCGQSENNTETVTLLCGGCNDPARPVCDAASQSCVACLSDEDCSKQNNGLNACLKNEHAEENRCVACTAESERITCGEYSCNPVTNECTDTKRGTLDICMACNADSECKSDDTHVRRCIPISFRGDLDNVILERGINAIVKAEIG